MYLTVYLQGEEHPPTWQGNIVGNMTHQVACLPVAFILVPRFCFKTNWFKFLTSVYRWYPWKRCLVHGVACFTCCTEPHMPAQRRLPVLTGNTVDWFWATLHWPHEGPVSNDIFPHLSLFYSAFVLFPSCPCWGRSPIACFVLGSPPSTCTKYWVTLLLTCFGHKSVAIPVHLSAYLEAI